MHFFCALPPLILRSLPEDFFKPQHFLQEVASLNTYVLVFKIIDRKPSFFRHYLIYFFVITVPHFRNQSQTSKDFVLVFFLFHLNCPLQKIELFCCVFESPFAYPPMYVCAYIHSVYAYPVAFCLLLANVIIPHSFLDFAMPTTTQ